MNLKNLFGSLVVGCVFLSGCSDRGDSRPAAERVKASIKQDVCRGEELDRLGIMAPVDYEYGRLGPRAVSAFLDRVDKNPELERALLYTKNQGVNIRFGNSGGVFGLAGEINSSGVYINPHEHCASDAKIIKFLMGSKK